MAHNQIHRRPHRRKLFDNVKCHQMRNRAAQVIPLTTVMFLDLLILMVSLQAIAASPQAQQPTSRGLGTGQAVPLAGPWSLSTVKGGIKSAPSLPTAHHTKPQTRATLKRARSTSASQLEKRKFLALVSNRPEPSPFTGLQPTTRQTRQTAQAMAQSQSKCALILQRTYVRKLSNDIDNDSEIEPTGRAERVCITYEHVNEAIDEAKTRRNFRLSADLMDAVRSIEPTPPYISRLGELNLETVKVLKERFDLSPDEISEGLPLIDMSRTNFWTICPLLVKPIKCDSTGRFRSFTGHCNNLNNPTWGASQTPFVRHLPARHPDGVEEFRRSVLDDGPLPPARLVSSTVHRDIDQPSGDLSLFIMVFGQLVDHELTQAAPPRGKCSSTILAKLINNVRERLEAFVRAQARARAVRAQAGSVPYAYYLHT